MSHFGRSGWPMRKQQKPKKRKASTTHSKGAKARHAAAEVLKDLAVVFVYSGPNTACRHYSLTLNRFVPTTNEMNIASSGYPQKWVASLSIINREKNGKIKIESTPVCVTDLDNPKRVLPIQFAELVDVLDYEHKAMIHGSKHQELLVNVGWIATANGKELTPEQEYRIYRQAGGWQNYLAPWEQDKIENERIKKEVA